jgi:hypothetical protein
MVQREVCVERHLEGNAADGQAVTVFDLVASEAVEVQLVFEHFECVDDV